MKKTVRKTESGYPLMRYLGLLLVVALLFSGVTFARYALERRGSIDTGVALFDASYTVEGVNSLTFGNSYYWKDEGNRWYEQGSARTVRIKMKNSSDVNVRANVLHMEGPAEFWENIALQLRTVNENDPAGVAAGQIITTQYVLADLLRVRTGGIKENSSGAILDADGKEATHQYEYGEYIDWKNNPTANKAEDREFDTKFSDEFGQRGNVEESLQMSGGITAGWAEGDNTFDLSRVTSFSGTVTAVRQSASASATDLTKMPLTITITASMKEEVPYSVGFARRRGPAALHIQQILPSRRRAPRACMCAAAHCIIGARFRWRVIWPMRITIICFISTPVRIFQRLRQILTRTMVYMLKAGRWNRRARSTSPSPACRMIKIRRMITRKL